MTSKANPPGASPAAIVLRPVTAHDLTTQGLSTQGGLTTHGLVYFEIGVPHELRDAVERHHCNLNLLAQQLRQAGVSESEATAHLDVAIASYRNALQIAATSIRSAQR